MIRIFMIGMSANKGGVESYITNLCDQLRGRYEIIYRLPKMEIDGVVWECPPNRHNYFRYWRFWRKFFRQNHFDVIYYNTCDIVSIDMLRFAKAAAIPVRIIHSHSTENQMKMTIFHFLTEWINRKVISYYATKLLACSQAAGRWMFGQKSFEIVKNGIDLNKFAFSKAGRMACRREIGATSEIIIGCVGRLTREKNPMFIIKVAEELLKKLSNIRVILIGDGELRSQLENEIGRMKLQNHVTLMGTRDDVYQWYSAFDCLLMPSLFEGLPFALVEAQASGLPCVVSSNVSKEADLTGLLTYIGLDQPEEVWADNILEASKKPRLDTMQKMIDGGYSIQNTAAKVADTIDLAFRESNF